MRLPNLLVAFDTETDSVPVDDRTVEARLRFGWASFSRRHRGLRWTPPRWLRFTSGPDLWAAVEAAVPEGWQALVVAHNAGFDLRVTDAFRILPAAGWKLRGAVIDDPPTILRWRKGRRSLLVLDSLNYFRSSLAHVGRELGLDKLDMPPLDDSPEAWDAYCRRDVEIVAAAMQQLMAKVRQWDLGNLSPTLPGQAFTAWRHRHLTAPILIDANGEALALARAAYHGGRTEAFRVGPVPGPVEVYDVSSMYPSIMAGTPMPTVLRGVYRTMPIPELQAATESMAAVVDVTLRTEEAAYPLAHDGRLIFPVGSFRTVLAGPELTHALVLDRVAAVHRVVLYDQAVIFRSYVEEWWARRSEALAAGNVADAYFCKLMMNALYGKLGQRGRVYEDRGSWDPADARTWDELDIDTGTVHRFRAIGGLLQELVAEIEGRDSHPAIAATVTSAARLHLWRLIAAAGRRQVAYVDTDSLFVLGGPLRAVSGALEPRQLGGLAHVRHIDALTIYGPKDYLADSKRVTKGVRANASELAPGVYRQDTFVGLKGALAEGDISRQLIRKTVKRLARTYDKGVVGPRGHVRPWRFSPGCDVPS